MQTPKERAENLCLLLGLDPVEELEDIKSPAELNCVIMLLAMQHADLQERLAEAQQRQMDSMTTAQLDEQAAAWLA